MILLISNELDRTTDKIIDWLLYYSCKYIRINKEDEIVNVNISINNKGTNICLELENNIVELDKIKAVWYRKNGLSFTFNLNSRTKINRKDLCSYEENELNVIQEFVEYTLLSKPILGKSIVFKNLNKLSVLQQAKSVGLTIPNTILTNKKQDIPKFPSISKAISEILYVDFGFWKFKKRLITYTVDLVEKYVTELPDSFLALSKNVWVTRLTQVCKNAYSIKINQYRQLINKQ